MTSYMHTPRVGTYCCSLYWQFTSWMQTPHIIQHASSLGRHFDANKATSQSGKPHSEYRGFQSKTSASSLQISMLLLYFFSSCLLLPGVNTCNYDSVKLKKLIPWKQDHEYCVSWTWIWKRNFFSPHSYSSSCTTAESGHPYPYINKEWNTSHLALDVCIWTNHLSPVTGFRLPLLDKKNHTLNLHVCLHLMGKGVLNSSSDVSPSCVTKFMQAESHPKCL